MKKLVVLIFACFTLFTLILFRPVFFQQKILFPSNLLASAYSPWKYEPVPEYPNGPPNKPMGFDDIRQFFPNRKLLGESFAKGVIPLWNPYIYSGTPFMASFDTAVWYPLSWIAALMPAVEGWNFLVIVQPILSLLFMYLFLKSLRFDPRVCTFGALAYAFSGWMIVYWQEILVLEHSFLWLPLALYASNRLWEKAHDRVAFTLLIVALTSSIFGGFLQMSIYVYLTVILWNVYLSVINRKKNMRIVTAVILSVLIAGIQLIPSIEAFFLSPRGTEAGQQTFQNGLLPWTHIITLIAPDFWGNPDVYNYFGGPGFYFEKMIYIGIIPLIFALYGFVSKGEKRSIFWKISAVIFLSLGFALPTSWLPYFLRIPVLSNSYPTRIFALYAFSAVVLACFGLRAYVASPNRRKLAWILLFCTAALAALWAWVGAFWLLTYRYDLAVDWCGKLTGICQITALSPLRSIGTLYATVSLRNLLVPTAVLGASWILIVGSKYFKNIVFLVAMTLAMGSSFYFAHKYLQFSERRFVYPSLPVIEKISEVAAYDRAWGYGSAFIEKNLAQYYSWFSSDGYGNLSSKRYAELLSTIINNGKLGGTMRRSDTDLYETSQRDSMLSNPYRLRLMSLLGVKYILELKQPKTTEARFPDSHFTLTWENEKWRIWEYKKALPRVLFATNYLVKPNPQELINALYDPKIHLDTTVLLEEDPGVKLVAATAVRAEIISYELNTVRIRTESDVDGFVLLSDNYYPGWSATVDGQKTKIYRTDYTFKSVFVPKGEHEVVFRYAPLSVIIGGLATLGGIIAILVL